MINPNEFSVILNDVLVKPIKHNISSLKKENIELRKRNNLLILWLIILSFICLMNTVFIIYTRNT